MNAAKAGFIAEFEIGYLQREIRVLATVSGGKDKGLRDKTTLGFAVGRLVKVTSVGDSKAIVAATGVSASSLGDATHIVAQSDDSIREGSFAGDPERYSTLPNLVVANSTTDKKTVALFKITNSDDIKIIALGGTDPYAAS